MAEPRRIPLTAPAIRLPGWVGPWLTANAQRGRIRSSAGRMALAIGLAAENVRRRTGGPFGAAVFEPRGGRLVAVGMNRVLETGQSHAHAEMLALALAQRARQTFDLAGLELVTSSEPCAMCFGAIPWSGIHHLVCGARAADAEAIGFDEGPKPRDWVAELERRGITVVRDVGRADAVAVLEAYGAAGAPVY